MMYDNRLPLRGAVPVPLVTVHRRSGTGDRPTDCANNEERMYAIAVYINVIQFREADGAEVNSPSNWQQQETSDDDEVSTYLC